MEPSFKRPIKLLPSPSQHPAEVLASEEVPFEVDQPGPHDRSMTITIPCGVISKKGVRLIIDGIKALMQEEDHQDYVNGRWPDVLVGGSQQLRKVSSVITSTFIKCLDFHVLPMNLSIRRRFRWPGVGSYLSRSRIASLARITLGGLKEQKQSPSSSS